MHFILWSTGPFMSFSPGTREVDKVGLALIIENLEGGWMSLESLEVTSTEESAYMESKQRWRNLEFKLAALCMLCISLTNPHSTNS